MNKTIAQDASVYSKRHMKIIFRMPVSTVRGASAAVNILFDVSNDQTNTSLDLKRSSR